MIELSRHILIGLWVFLSSTTICAQTQSLGKINPNLIEAVFIEICKLNIKQPEVVMRQAILETGWMRAPYLMKRNNLFGFRKTSYLVFNQWQDSVSYYKTWQEKNYNPNMHKDYYGFLDSVRYASAGYTQHLRKIQWTKSCPVDKSINLDFPIFSESPGTLPKSD
jgi:hypothetical protein